MNKTKYLLLFKNKEDKDDIISKSIFNQWSDEHKIQCNRIADGIERNELKKVVWDMCKVKIKKEKVKNAS